MLITHELGANPHCWETGNETSFNFFDFPTTVLMIIMDRGPITQDKCFFQMSYFFNHKQNKV